VMAVSFANLCFLNVWEPLEDSSESYFRQTPPPLASLGAVATAVLLVAGILFAAAVLVRRFTSLRAQQIIGVAATVLLLQPINLLSIRFFDRPIETLHPSFTNHHNLQLVLFTLSVTVPAFVVLARWRRTVLRIARGMLLAAAPLVPIFLVGASWQVLHGRTWGAQQGPAAPILAHAAGPRVVWIIFDEMDQDLAFTARPSWLSLPELDRFRAESIYATQATSPVLFGTIDAMPSLITGRQVAAVRPAGPSDLQIRYTENGRPTSWAAEPTIFSAVRDRGLNGAIAGWYHPYGRLFGSSVTQCFWRHTACASDFLMSEHYIETRGVWKGALDLIQRQAAKLPVPHHYGGYYAGESTRRDWKAYQEQQVSDYLEIRKRALRLATDSRMDLVFLHWPVPHPVGIFNHVTGKVTTDTETNYLDNLQLVDITVGELRRAMEKSGTWDKTTVLISSDHPLRNIWEPGLQWEREELETLRSRRFGYHVPFLLKLAGQKSGVAYEGRLNTVITHDLILQLLDGKLDTREQVVSFMGRGGRELTRGSEER